MSTIKMTRKVQMELSAENRANRKREIAERREHKAYVKERAAFDRREKQLFLREKKLLKFMLKTDVLYYHHGKSDSLKENLKQALERCLLNGDYERYNQYIWNIQGEGCNYMPLAQLSHLWSSSEFATIYDVPLDGTHLFYCTDSGQRGLGAFHNMRVRRADDPAFVPQVNSGAFPY